MLQETGERFTPTDAIELYGVHRWGNGYFGIQPNGALAVYPDGPEGAAIELPEVVARVRQQGLETPLLIRFPQLLQKQVQRLTGAFEAARKEFHYEGGYRPLFPIKVNQTRSVITHLLEAGREAGLGLEVGSRAELLAALSLPAAEDSMIICNGFKDTAYLSTAALATALGRKTVVVIEKPFELDGYLAMARSTESIPEIGIRVRLNARGSGLWEKSGGFASKFGLTIRQLPQMIARLEREGLSGRLQLLHFHIGSQITEIRKIKLAVLEAARIYAKLRKRGTKIRYLDVGGGLGIDYDGSRTSSDASVNYSVQEYANDVIFGIHEVCEQEGVPVPDVLSESGRMLVGYHSVLVTDVRAVVRGVDSEPTQMKGTEAQVVQDLAEVEARLTVKNYREFYHDAVAYRDQMLQSFQLGHIDIDERAVAEHIFWKIAQKTVQFSKSAKFVTQEFLDLKRRLRDKYICNFSVFQSLPDHWALDQLFPVMPIHRLDERPTVKATLADITCDSDGEVELFVDLKDIKTALDVHPVVAGEPYYLGFAMIGAYQDTMGDLHNLFGRVHEAEVTVDDEGDLALSAIRRGHNAESVATWFGFEAEEMLARVKAGIRRRTADGAISTEQAETLFAEYRLRLSQYTYLS
jgi:arginine decarboxylase